MKRLIIWFGLLLLSVWVGLKMQASPGYVLLSYDDWVLETTLWFAIFAIIVLVFIWSKLLRLLGFVASIASRWRNWRIARRRRNAQDLTSKGLRYLAEGDWRAAEKNLVKAAPDSEAPLINYLAAANAAQARLDVKRRDEYLQLAFLSTADADVAVGLTQAELQLGTKELDDARRTLEHLNEKIPRHPQVLMLLQKVYVEQGDWHGVQTVLPELKKRDILAPHELHWLEKQMHVVILREQLIDANLETVTKLWKQVPKSLHEDPDLLVMYTDALLHNNDIDYAEKLLRKALSRNWDRQLLRQYVKVPSSNPSKQLSQAESWLNDHPNDMELLICLGKLCIRHRLWGKAEGYLARARQVEDEPETLLDLGRVYEQLQDKSLALQCYRDGLILATRS
ncbi:MAG: hypothetical protein M3R00_07815 [Pseudomonadota bacterium]|nr:hypothetical protein [Pseudomonadota bacterium]